MAEEGEKSADTAPKKSKTGLIIGIVIAVITLVGGSVAGAVLGPRLLGAAEPHDAKPAPPAEEHHAAAATEKIVSVEIPAVVVDLRDSDGRIRHLKVGMAAELAETVSVEEFKLVMPRGREAILSYLRSLTFEEVSDPARYVGIKDELSKHVMEAVGAERMHRVLLVDFVLQ
jgi:flagellar basal body-associated protein FliL